MCARITLLAWLLLLLWGVVPEPAAACEPGVCHQDILPADGAQDVVLNTGIWLFYSVGGSYSPALALKDDNGAVVPTEMTQVMRGGLALIREVVMVFQPTELLSASTTYTIEVTDAPICDNWDVPGDGIIIQTFTTGTTSDTAPPAFGGAATIAAEFVEATPPIGPCDAGPDRFRYTVTANAAEAGSIYTMYLDGQNVDMQTSSTVKYEVEGSGDIPPLCFTMRAQDQAGNEETNDQQVCFSPPTDGGTQDGGAGDEAVVGDDAGIESDEDPGKSDGCSCGSSSSASGWGFLLLFSLFLISRDRKRPAVR